MFYILDESPGLTKEVFNQLYIDGVLKDYEEVLRLTYLGGVDPELRKMVRQFCISLLHSIKRFPLLVSKFVKLWNFFVLTYLKVIRGNFIEFGPFFCRLGINPEPKFHY